jgi:hypothetical protein
MGRFMRLVRLLPVLWLAACAGGGGADGEVRIKVRLENHDPHLYDVAAVDLDLRRDNVVVRDRLAALAGQLLTFPVEVIVKVPIGAGALLVEAIPRDREGQALGGGEGQVTAASGSIAAVTVALLSDRNRPARGRAGAGTDGGLLADAAAPPEDAAPDAAPQADGPEPTADAAPEPCVPRTHRLPASAVLSLDYGPPPRDREDTRVAVSSGFSHDHVHDFVGWMRFDVRVVPDSARLTSAKVSLVLTRSPMVIPPLAILYSATDRWDPATLTSDLAELIARTARVSGDLGPPRNGRADYQVDPERYRTFFAGDLADDAVTLGLVSTTPPMAPESWADFYGLDPTDLAPTLELETCE